MGSERSAPDWLRLSLIPGASGAVIRRLISAFGTAEAALSASLPALERVVPAEVSSAIQRGPDEASVAAALDWAEAPGRLILTVADPRYPRLLGEIADPPPVLYSIGRIELLNVPAIAVVGSRNATAQGIRNAEAFARALSESGFCIVSGLALGVDAAAHRGGLMAAGSSIAVLGNGIDVVYPPRNRDLQQALASQGLIISEFPLGTPARSSNFPRRNRIISGLSLGCLVIEAALPSGSLITARMAADQGREVFAIPGSIHSPLARGCHHLIRQGAKLVETAQDILEEFGHIARTATPSRSSPATDPETARLLEALGDDPCDVNTLCERCGYAVDAALSLLLQLELDGRVARLPGGHYQRLR